MNRYYISFLGSHDLGTIDNGPVSTQLKYLKPSHVYLFITEDYYNKNNIEELKRYHQQDNSTNIFIINSQIKDPTNHREISAKITKELEKINEKAAETKSQVFINLTSGTPAIISVLSLLAMTGFLNRCVGIYAPNPKYNNVIKTDSLDFYQNSFAYKTIKSLINDKEYNATIRFLEQNKILKNLSADKDFMDILRFANYRIVGDFDEALKIYNNNEHLSKISYKKPENLYECALEYFISAQGAIAKNDTFQAILKLGIIREILTSFLCKKLIKERFAEEIIIYPNKEDTPPRFNINNLELYAQDLKEYILSVQKQSKSVLNFDFNREINAYTESLILCYLIDSSENNNLLKIKKNFNSLEDLKGERNKLAHRLSAPKFKTKWNECIKEILNLTAEVFSYEKPSYSTYKEINNILIEKLKQSLK